jgi:hypothetical protein
MEHNPHTPEGYPTPASNGVPETTPPESTNASAERPPELGELTEMLFAFERQLDGGGWDQPSCVFSLNHMPDDIIGIRPLLTPPPGVHPATLMEWATEDIRTDEGQEQLIETLGSGYFGLVLACEGWSRAGDSLATTDPTRPFADQLGSVECRVVNLRTVDGTEVTVERLRGQEPQLHPNVTLGRIPDAMSNLMDSIANALRDAGQ